jgi:TATA-box binding protein (TBP) (component of TFIID and TFIIIB)
MHSGSAANNNSNRAFNDTIVVVRDVAIAASDNTYVHIMGIVISEDLPLSVNIL